MTAKHYGKCALCGTETELTYEHIPPRKAFNWFGNKAISSDEIMELIGSDRLPWERDGLRYNNQQRGAGEFCLCRQCNNITGTLYGEEYVKFVTTLHSAICTVNPAPQEYIHFEMQDVRPNPIVKQILSMFCSTNHCYCDDKRIALLRQFVLDKNSKLSLEGKYKLCMYIFGGGSGKRLPLMVQIKHTHDFSQWQTIVMSEITAYPVGFILYFDPPKDLKSSGVNITSFSECNYEDKATIKMNLPVFESQTVFPEDFRSKNDILECVTENKKWREEHGL